MAVFCLGSINIDHFYRVPHLPAAGETLGALGHSYGLGGKGANQSVAAARAGALVRHIGAIGAGDEWILHQLGEFGVDTSGIRLLDDTATGHAIIYLDAAGENSIVISAGANGMQDRAHVRAVLSDGGRGDVLLVQNETDLQAEAAAMARAKGMAVLYSAAPFDADAVREVLPHITALSMNAVEAAQLSEALAVPLTDIPVAELIVTRGGEGADWYDIAGGNKLSIPAVAVQVVDTTGAGDTFTGYFAAGRDRGLTPHEAMTWAMKAAALKVTRQGTAAAIPSANDVAAFENIF